MEIGLLLVGLVVGALVGWLARQASTRTALDALRRDAEVQAARHEADLARASEQEAAARAEVIEKLSAARAEVTARLSAARASEDELRAALAEARAQHRDLVEQHRAAQAERERAESGQTQVLKTLSPVVEHLRSMQQKVDDLERARVRQHTELATQIQHTQRSVEDSRKAADSLASALRNNAVRGTWARRSSARSSRPPGCSTGSTSSCSTPSRPTPATGDRTW